ncbi:MAG: hypothetical protein DHS20C05_18360 [Hyphococcus sp.]|nr:MAG: hypothetical protein DHS20C05_18360 [Marinicaulis sp.]
MLTTVYTAGALFSPASLYAAEATIVRPGPCSAQAASYLLAGNSAAIVRIGPEQAAGTSDPIIIVFRPQQTRGWASQRLLSRFDLKLDESGGRIINSGAFCTEGPGSNPSKEPGS